MKGQAWSIGRHRKVALATSMVLLAVGCATTTPSPGPAMPAPPSLAATTDCDAFAPDTSDEFFTPVDVSFDDPTPIDWPTGTPAEVGLDESLLAAAADNAALSADLRSLLVVRHGKLVFERYFNGSDPGEANTIASASKSILSVATGIAIDEGLLALDSRIDEFLPPDLVGAHGDLTIEHLLTMSGGLAKSEDPEYVADVGPSDLPGEPSFVRAVLKRESVDPAGTKFAYSTGLTQVLAAVLTEATGRSLCAYLTDRLLAPLGIDVEQWWVEPDGYFAGGHSVFITPREMARFGQLMLQHGTWDGEQLVSTGWLDRSLAERWDLGCRGVLGAHQGYGFLWWLYDVDGYEVWNASGYGGQDVWIAPELELVVVLTHDATRVGQPDHHELVPGAIARAAIFETVGSAARPPRCPPFEFRASTMQPDGSGRSAVRGWPVGGMPMSWSSDGNRLAIQLDRRDLNPEIYTIAPDGTALRRVTRDLSPDILPAFSPDGSRVAFTRGGPSTGDLYVVGSDGAGERRLTDFDGYENSPTWSADGTRIAFVWGKEDVNGFGESGALWAIDADGSDRALLLDARVGYPVWSPDGTRIALELRDDDHIGVLDIATGAVTDLGAGFVPKWSPDGARLAFIRETGSTTDIFVMDADGANAVQLTEDDAFDTFPIWSPDGTTILFMSAAHD